MKLLKRLKPQQKKIDVKSLKAKDLHYFCPTSDIDRLVCKQKKVPYSEELASEIAKHVDFYFIVLKDGVYDVVSGVNFAPFLKDNGIETLTKSGLAEKCINHYIQKVHYGR
ncbi:hypothetical protein [Parapedobacter indicus]|uniref:Uncharacterized protein n=1 Tax=Parapedobacter indicus TaxID=1477437 RepID=A0A1I3V2R9_9SPHI|nr:hypothetical protein [Parapedobacter indicus]PPK98993.1 hypothetical protein CLV26_11523 [Parapedobacter indicus]SFJ89259.1 hypothetical protein SAMN05444682_115154 [Parapedobacter indicus]